MKLKRFFELVGLSFIIFAFIVNLFLIKIISAFIANPFLIEKIFGTEGKFDSERVYYFIGLIDLIIILFGGSIYFMAARGVEIFSAKGKSRKKNFLTLLFSIFISTLIFLVFFISLELYLNKRENNWLQFHGKFDPELGWVSQDNLKFFGTQGGEFTTNSLGFRSEEIDESKEHIILLGDSVVWGINVSDEETSSRYLQNLLNENGYHDYQVVNLGVSGYSVDQYYLYLKRNIRYLNPKVVFLVIYTGNDIEGTGRNFMGREKPIFDVQGGELVNLTSEINRFSCINIFWASRIINNFLEYSSLYNKVVDNFCGRIRTELLKSEEILIALLAEIDGLVKENRGDIIHVLSPSFYDFKERSWQYKWFNSVYSSSIYRRINYFDDIAEEYVSPVELFADTAHYTSKGNLRLAGTLFEYLEENSLIEK